MSQLFKPNYSMTPKMTQDLIEIEVTKTKIQYLPLTPHVLKSLRESARLHTTHYSTMIEGNRLSTDQIKEVIAHEGHFPGRERDEQEVKGYYAALTQVEYSAQKREPLSEYFIQILHALVMSNGKTKVTPSAYRDGQNVIRDGVRGTIIYMPPEASDVPKLMNSLVTWVNENKALPVPLIASIAHYQYATIHPYYDGNGRTARLVTTLILHLGGYDLKGLYSLEEYYAKNLPAYYAAISIGPSHNYYLGRAEADITGWIEYFIEGMKFAFQKVEKNMKLAALVAQHDHAPLLRTLDPKKRKALILFSEYDVVTAKQIGELFGFKDRTNSHLCKKWVEEGFLEVVDPSKKGRKYSLAGDYKALVV